MRNEVQVIAMPMSVEMVNPPDIIALIAASAALTISRIPFDGPIGRCKGSASRRPIRILPTWDQMQAADMNVIIAGTRGAVTTI